MPMYIIAVVSFFFFCVPMYSCNWILILLVPIQYTIYPVCCLQNLLTLDADCSYNYLESTCDITTIMKWFSKLASH